MSTLKNKKLLDEMNQAGRWVHAHKTRPVWAKQVDAQMVVDTLEGNVTANAGDFLCRGVDGELWPQSARSLTTNYTPTKVVDGDGWRMFLPQRAASGILAAVVHRPFTVSTPWGTLSGRAGDYLVKRQTDEHADYPEDVWIVAKNLFRKTYRIVTKKS